jgi:dTDP-4-dehydrorhamnose reductase
MRILVTGKNGQVGQSIQNIVNKTSSTDLKDYDFVFIGRDELDLSEAASIQAYFEKNKFDMAINCAAYTSVEQAEVEENDANLINFLAVKEIATIAKKNNMKLIHISTDFVFDGDKSQPYIETDTTSPKNIYGRTKLAGELAAISIMKFNAIVLRSSWIYSEYGNNFVDTIIKNAKLKGQLDIISDQIGTPTYAYDLAQTIINILSKDKSRKREMTSQIYHYSNEGECTWFDFAKEIIDILKIDCNLNPITTDDYPQLAKRPRYSVLSKKKISEEFDLNINNWKDSLKHCLNNIEVSSKTL